jgi:predicted alpha/beta-fold hydrolase
MILIFHGLQGSVKSSYAVGMQQALAAQGWATCVVHFRGCSGRGNRQWRGYHSGAYQDAAEAIGYCHRTFPESPLAAIGYSLGGNMLANYLVKVKGHPLVASVIISAPFQLAACAERINSGFSKIYQWSLLRGMKRSLIKKIACHKDTLLNPRQVNGWKTFVEFDSGYTAPAHGFKDAADYYSQCSALPYLK